MLPGDASDSRSNDEIFRFQTSTRSPRKARTDFQVTTAHKLLMVKRSSLHRQVFSLRLWYGNRTRDFQINGLVLCPLS